MVINRWAAGTSKDGVGITGTFVGVVDFGPPTTAMASVANAGYLLQM